MKYLKNNYKMSLNLIESCSSNQDLKKVNLFRVKSRVFCCAGAITVVLWYYSLNVIHNFVI